MILTKKEILKEIDKGNIVISPLNKKNIGPASMDLTLDNKFRVFHKIKGLIKADDKADYTRHTDVVKADGQIIMQPGECILGITKEKITLPGDICGWLQGRSRFARIGLMVHITASFMQPGISNRQVLELFNASGTQIAIIPGTKICQFIFQRCEGSARYSGRFKDQKI